MEIKTFGDPGDRKVLLLSMEPSIIKYIKDAYIIWPIWNGHNVNDGTDFVDRYQEAKDIGQALVDRGWQQIDLVFGFSYGASIGWELIREGQVHFNQAVFDGGAFSSFGPLTRLANYLGTSYMARQARKAGDGPSPYQKMYPNIDPEDARALDEIIAHWSKETIKNMVNDSMQEPRSGTNPIPEDCQVQILYGSKDNYIKGLDYFKKNSYPVQTRIFDGLGHCEYCISQPDKYADEFLNP